MKITQKIRKSLKINSLSKKWKKLNKHNFTNIKNDINDNLIPIDKVKVGANTYGNLLVYSYGSSDEFLSIGSYCSIAENVKFILGGMHNYNYLSTYPFKAKLLSNCVEAYSKGPIVIEDDVWIGANSIILSGCKLARGSIVAAGSIVTKSTEPYSIVGGNPATFIKKRFPNEIIENLMKIENYPNFIENLLSNKKIDYLYKKVDIDIINDLSLNF